MMPSSLREAHLARLQRQRPQVLAVERQEVEAVGEHVTVDAARDERVEVRHAVVAAEHRLSVDDEHPRLEPPGLVDDARETVRPLIAASREQPDAIAVARDDQSEAIVLEFVQPFRASRDGGGDYR
jgi:hypothetical protein